MYACISEIGGGFSEGVCTPCNATANFCDPPHPATQKNRSPGNRTPARRGARTALPWTALYLGVEIDHHPSCARAPLASHPRTTLNIEHAPLKASRTGALLV